MCIEGNFHISACLLIHRSALFCPSHRPQAQAPSFRVTCRPSSHPSLVGSSGSPSLPGTDIIPPKISMETPAHRNSPPKMSIRCRSIESIPEISVRFHIHRFLSPKISMGGGWWDVHPRRTCSEPRRVDDEKRTWTRIAAEMASPAALRLMSDLKSIKQEPPEVRGRANGDVGGRRTHAREGRFLSWSREAWTWTSTRRECAFVREGNESNRDTKQEGKERACATDAWLTRRLPFGNAVTEWTGMQRESAIR